MRRLFEGGAYLRAALIKRLIPHSQNILIVQANADNLLTATVTGKRKREVGLLLPAKFIAFTQELKNANILKRELNERASRYTHFKLKTSLLMKINSHCWLRTALQRLQCIFIILWKYSNNRRTGAAALIRGRRLLTIPLHVRRLIEGGACSGAALIRVNTVNSNLIGDITVYKLKTLYSYHLLAPTSFTYCYVLLVSDTNLDCNLVHVPYVRYHNTVTSGNPGKNRPALTNCP